MENFSFNGLLVEAGSGWLEVMDSSLDYELCKKKKIKATKPLENRDTTYMTCKGSTNRQCFHRDI